MVEAFSCIACKLF
jgi:hypothetical protein